MNSASVATVLDFEVYLLMTMKLRIKMLHDEAQLEAKLAEHQLSLDDGERIHERIAEALDDEASRFARMKNLLGIAEPGSVSVKYGSVLWPGFDFNATAGEDGGIESARYWHTRRDPSRASSPIGLPIWSMDVTEFTERFGPIVGSRQWPLFDKLLPAYEECEFLWDGQSYGAGFSWGLFIFSAKSWD
ncbi:hypothetical protein E2F47_23465 [Mycobacterium eburneum]|nr:hypothetical protein E2F47_23465 [Mycobacterium eburneum]